MTFARRWLAPDLALVAAIATLIYCLTGFNARRELFRDPDTGWHIVTGEKILEQHRLPLDDPYTFTQAGPPWFARDWAADCVMGLAYAKAGMPGMVWTFVLAIALLTWMWFRFTWAVNGNFLLACPLFLLMVSSARAGWLALPHVFGCLLLLATVWFFEKPRLSFRIRDFAAIASLAAAWANIDDTFLLLPATALIYAISYFARPLIWNLDASAEIVRGRSFLIAALITALATLLNPYRWSLSAPSFDCRLTVTLGIALLGGVLALTQKKLAHFLLVALLACTPQGVPAAALVLLPIANGAITSSIRRTHDFRPGLRRATTSLLTYSDRLRLLDDRRAGVAWALLAAVLALLWLRLPSIAAHTGFPPERFPVIAANELTLLPPDARILAPPEYGGYIIFRFQGARKVLVFEGHHYERLFEARPGWQIDLDRLNVSNALLPANSPLIPALQQLHWRVVFRDETATLLAIPAPSNSKQTQ